MAFQYLVGQAEDLFNVTLNYKLQDLPVSHFKRGRPSKSIVHVKSYSASNKERKFHDVIIVSSAFVVGNILAGGTLLVIPIGTTGITRVGRRINITDIFIRGTHTLPGTGTPADTGDTYRFILYLDRQANGATAAVTDILASATINAFNNLNNVSRFRILADKQTSFSSTGGTEPVVGDYGQCKKNFFIDVKDMNLPIEYSGDDGAIDKIRSNNIGVLLISKQGLVTVDFTARIRYTD